MRLFKEKEIRRIAQKSDHRWAHHVAILTVAGRVVAVGYNRGLGHAEDMALRKMQMAGERANRLYSYRIRRDGNIGASRPCEVCLSKLRAAGVLYVFYSDYEGRPQRMML
jgi:deoxycytidylate deaminase